MTFVRQHFKTCAPATLAAIGRFFRLPAAHLQLAETICYDGTPHWLQREWAEQNGWHVRSFRITLESAVALIERGRSYLSPELSAREARAAAESAARGGSDVHREIERLSLRLAAAIEETVASALADSPGESAAEAALPEELLWRLRPELDAAFVDYLEYRRETRSFVADDEFVQAHVDDWRRP